MEINPRFYRGMKKCEAKIKSASRAQAQEGNLWVSVFFIGPFVQRYSPVRGDAVRQRGCGIRRMAPP